MLNQWSLRLDFLLPILFGSLIIFLTPRESPLFADGESYILMAENLSLAKDTVSNHFLQRLLPTFIVSIFSDVFSVPIPRSFSHVSSIMFLILTTYLYTFLKRELKDLVVSFSFTVILLTAFWPITYNLLNVYQLCDLMTYLFVLGMLISYMDRKFYLFLFLPF